MDKKRFFQNLTDSIAEKHGYSPIISNVFITMLDIILKQNLEGSCHPTSSILYVILNELGFNVSLNIGEVQIDNRFFDHSWIDLDGLIIDASLINPINKNLGLSPVFLNIELNSNQITTLKYGKQSTLGLSEYTKIIINRPFNKYMNPYPWGKGKWIIVESISKTLNLNINISELPKKYQNTKRNLICQNF